MIINLRGFLLLEAVVSLALLTFMSSLILTWSMGRVRAYQLMNERVQALFLARATLDLLTLKKTPPHEKDLWDISLEEYKDPLLLLAHVSVTVRRNRWPEQERIILTSAYVL